MQNLDLCKFGFDNFRSSDGCNFTLQKIKNGAEDSMFSNAVKIIIFISDVQYYVPIKLMQNCMRSIHLFKIIGTC